MRITKEGKVIKNGMQGHEKGGLHLNTEVNTKVNLVHKCVGTATLDVFIPYKENVNINDLDAWKFKTQGYLNENAPQYTRFYAK